MGPLAYFFKTQIVNRGNIILKFCLLKMLLPAFINPHNINAQTSFDIFEEIKINMVQNDKELLNFSVL